MSLTNARMPSLRDEHLEKELADAKAKNIKVKKIKKVEKKLGKKKGK